MNEFVARKGLISQKSSSFLETLFVSGSISSTKEAFLTSSWSKNTISSSYAATASYVALAKTASYIATASYAMNSGTSSYIKNAETASYALVAQTLIGTIASASYSISSSYSQTASVAINSISSSYLSGSKAIVGSFTASFVSASVITASALYTDMFKATVSTMSVGYLTVTQVINGTSSWANDALSASYVPASSIDVFNTSRDGTCVGGVLLVEHFLAPTTALINTFASTVSGTSAAITIVTGSVSHPGVIQLSTGTTATGRASAVSAATCILFGSGSYIFEADVQCPVLSASTQRFVLYVGFGGVSGAGDMTNGAYFQYSDANSTFWQLKTADNSTRTTVTTSVPVVAGVWNKLRIVVTNTTNVDFYIDNAYVGSINTNIPSIVGRETGIITKIEKSVGTTARTALLDYIKVSYK